MKIKSNAKINLNLKIIGTKDGYHMLDSVFVPISIYDLIEINESDKDEIIGMDISLSDNIIFKAINLVRNKFNINKKYQIKINKEIPMQAGLGGGSSNCAMVLKALNEMNNLGLSQGDLASLGLELGSDVPFFIYNKVANVYGRGEIIKPIEDFKKIYGVIVFDNLHFNTKEVYDTYDKIECANNKLDNDLEIAARELPKGNKIIEIEIDLISLNAYKANLTGSGGAVFGLFNDEETAKAVEQKLKNKYQFVKYFESL